MKRIILVLGFFALLSLTGCEKPLKNSGEITVPNGKGEETKISYTCDSCLEYIKEVDVFNGMIDGMNQKTRNVLKYPLSFVPVSIDINIKTVTGRYYYLSNKPVRNTYNAFFKYKYIAKNTYGTEIEGEQDGVISISNSKIEDDFYKSLRLDGLYIIKSDKYDGLNRNLYLTGKDDGYIKITPLIENQKVHLAVESSFACVNEGTPLKFAFDASKMEIEVTPEGDSIAVITHPDDPDALEIKSWNDYNCDGKSYYTLTKKQLEYLKGKKVFYISMYYKKSIKCYLDMNEEDYFDQLASLVVN
jgi:hypothetical protein